jgi:YHS domain-containing protein
VPRSRSLTARIAGVEEYFCSEACRDKAKAEVARAS